jgi:hypothetical protein
MKRERQLSAVRRAFRRAVPPTTLSEIRNLRCAKTDRAVLQCVVISSGQMHARARDGAAVHFQRALASERGWFEGWV